MYDKEQTFGILSQIQNAAETILKNSIVMTPI